MITIGALALGLVIGLSLGALGGGGSILTVPALVYLLGESAHQATTSSLVIVGITAAVATVGHGRAGRVHWRAGTLFGVVGIAASFVGTYLNRHVDPNVLLLGFAGLMLVAAAAMLRPRPVAVTVAERELVVAGGAGTPPALPSTGAPPPHHRGGAAARVLVAGLVVGFLTGFLGVGGGFVIVPALTVGLGYAMPAAIGTSLLIIAINSAAALAARVGHQTFHWAIIVPFAATAVLASLVGKRAADRVRPQTLSRAFAVFLVLVAGYVAVRSALSL